MRKILWKKQDKYFVLWVKKGKSKNIIWAARKKKGNKFLQCSQNMQDNKIQNSVKIKSIFYIKSLLMRIEFGGDDIAVKVMLPITKIS